MFDSAFKVANALQFLCATSVLALGSAQMAAADSDFPRIRSVALVGQHAPGTPDGVSFEGFPIVRPAVNDNGEVAFSARLAGDVTPDIDNFGVWSEGGGALHLIARGGDIVPGVTGESGEQVKFCNAFDEILINESGTTAFHAPFISIWSSCGSWALSSLWRETSGLLTIAAAAGDPAPGLEAGSTFQYFLQWPALNNMDDMAFSALYSEPDGSYGGGGVWMTDEGSTAAVAVPGMSDPDSGATVKTAGYPVVLNDGGAAAFQGGVDTGSGERYAVMRGDSSDLDLLAMVGDLASGLGGATFTYLFEHIAINNAGTIVFKGYTSSGVQGMWSAEDTVVAPELRLRTGDPAPGIAATFSGFYEPVMNTEGDVAFVGSAGGKWGVWVGAPEFLELAALNGEQAPGDLTDAEFCHFSPRLAINAVGDVAFIALLCAPGTTFPSVGRGIWVWNAEDGLIPVAVSGQQLDNPDVAGKQVAAVFTAFGNLNQFSGGGAYTSSGNEDGQPSALSDSGDLAFAVEFTDGSAGVFLATLRPDDPASLLQSLIDEVEQAGLVSGASKPLLKKLTNAHAKIMDENAANDGAAISLLEDFINILEAKAGKQVSDSFVAAWIEDAIQIVDLLSNSAG